MNPTSYTVVERSTTTLTVGHSSHHPIELTSTWTPPLNTVNTTRFQFLVQRNDFTFLPIVVGLSYNAVESELHVRYRVSIIDSLGQQCHTKEYEWHYLESDSTNSDINVHGYLNTEDVAALIINDKLTLQCDVELLELADQDSKILESDENPLITNLAAFLESGKLSDVVFEVSGKQFHLHKAIVGAQSPVWADMFQNEVKGKTENSIELTGISTEGMEQLARYLYTGKIPKMGEKHAKELLVAASKYQLEHLKSLCVKALSTRLDIDSAAQFLIFADQHNVSSLKDRCIDFINANSAAVQATEGWACLLKTRIELLVELYQKLTIN